LKENEERKKRVKWGVSAFLRKKLGRRKPGTPKEGGQSREKEALGNIKRKRTGKGGRERRGVGPVCYQLRLKTMKGRCCQRKKCANPKKIKTEVAQGDGHLKKRRGKEGEQNEYRTMCGIKKNFMVKQWVEMAWGCLTVAQKGGEGTRKKRA